MAYDTTEAVAKFLSGFQMKITNRERDTVAPDYYVKYSLTLSKGGKDFSTTFVSDPRAFGEPTVTQVFSALADEILNDLSHDEDYVPTDDAKDTITGAVSAAFEERYGEDFAEVATDFGQDIDDIAGRANPCILSVDTVRAVNEKGYDAVFAEQWKASFLSAISTRKRFPLAAKRTTWKTAGMGLMVTPRKRIPRKRTVEMRSRL